MCFGKHASWVVVAGSTPLVAQLFYKRQGLAVPLLSLGKVALVLGVRGRCLGEGGAVLRDQYRSRLSLPVMLRQRVLEPQRERQRGRRHW